MKRETLLTIAIVVLLVLNIGTLTFLFVSRPRHQGPPPPPPETRGPMIRPDELIRSTLQLTKEQDDKYVASIQTHHAAMMKLDSEFRSLADRYLKQLQSTAPATGESDALLAAIGKTQAGKAEATYKHFAEIKSLCTPEQAVKFDSIIPELTKMLLGQHGPGPHGPPPDGMHHDGPHGPGMPPPPPPRP